jgi:hypothetical protein
MNEVEQGLLGSDATNFFFTVFGSFIHGGKLEMTTDRCEFDSILHSSLLGLDGCESM